MVICFRCYGKSPNISLNCNYSGLQMCQSTETMSRKLTSVELPNLAGHYYPPLVVYIGVVVAYSYVSKFHSSYQWPSDITSELRSPNVMIKGNLSKLSKNLDIKFPPFAEGERDGLVELS